MGPEGVDGVPVHHQPFHFVPVHEPLPSDPPPAATRPGSAEHTDAAYLKWVAAQQAYDELPAHSPELADASRELQEARQAFERALQEEIRAHAFVGPVADERARVRASAGGVLERYANDAEAKTVVEGVIGQLQAGLPGKAPADPVTDLLNKATAQCTPADTLRTIQDGLGGLSPEDRKRLLTSPELATVLREKVRPWVEAPYGGFDGDLTGRDAVHAANESARRLAELTRDLPPELAYAVVQSNVDTLMKLAQLKPMYAGGEAKFGGTSFEDVSRALGAMGDSPEARQLRADVAAMYLAGGVDRGQGIPLAVTVGDAAKHGASPALGLEIARQLAADGQKELSGAVVDHLANAADSLSQRAEGDLGQYQSMLNDLAVLLERHKGLPPEAVNKAVQDYLAAQARDNPGWQRDFEALEGRLLDQARHLKELLSGLQGLPPEAKAGTENLDGRLKDIFNRESVLNLMGLAAEKDRTFLVGDQAEIVLDLADSNRVGAAGTDALQRLGNHAIQQNLTLIFARLEHGNPESVAHAKAELDRLGHQYGNLLGKNAEQYRQAIRHIGNLADLPPNASPLLARLHVEKLDRSLSTLEGFQANTPTGALFRMMGVAAGALAVVKYGEKSMDSDAAWRDVIATIGGGSGMSAPLVSLLSRPGTVNLADNPTFVGLRKEMAGQVHVQNWSRGLGAFSAAGDLAYMAEAMGRGDYTEASLHALAATGTVVLSLSTGPVGAVVGATMIAASLFGQVELAQHRGADKAHAASYDYLVAAGFKPDVAKILADTGETQGGPAVPAVPLLMEAARTGGLVGSEGQRLTPEQAMERINAMSGDAAKLEALQHQVNRLRYANQHLLIPIPPR